MLVMRFKFLVALVVMPISANAINPLFDQAPWALTSEASSPLNLARPLKKVEPPTDLPFLEGDREALKTALVIQRDRCLGLDLNVKRRFGKEHFTRQEWCVDSANEILNILKTTDNWEQVQYQLQDNFHWFKSIGSDNEERLGKVMFTGYYTPLLQGSFNKTERFWYPLYSRPKDLVQVRINGKKRWRKKNRDGSLGYFPSRHSIDYKRALEGQNLELVYVDNFVDAFFMQIQGSGKVRVEHNGKTQDLFFAYDAQNGRGYKSIGRILKDEGSPEVNWMSMQGLKAYLEYNPSEIERLFSLNQSYIFFRKADRPYTSLGVYPTAGVTIASDLRTFASGSIALIATERPDENNPSQNENWKEFSRIMLNQDTGGAIIGPGRVDIYWGEGKYAELAAGSMRHLGDLYFMVKKKDN